MRLRFFALVLALLLGATPLLGVVCQMDCDPPPAASACHESMASPDGPTVRGAQHACDHDHTAGSPALLASPSGRDSVGALVAVPVPALTHASIPDARLTVASMHGPPGLNARRTSSRVTVLRI